MKHISYCKANQRDSFSFFFITIVARKKYVGNKLFSVNI